MAQCLLGNKYGYRPFPYKIKATEFELLVQVSRKKYDEPETIESLLEWYKKVRILASHLFSIRDCCSCNYLSVTYFPVRQLESEVINIIIVIITMNFTKVVMKPLF